MRMDPGRIDHGSSGVSLSYSLKHLKKIVQCILEELMMHSVGIEEF